MNVANRASVNVDVGLGANSQSGDTITLKASDGVAAHGVTQSKAATAGAGLLAFTGLNLAGLTGGSITFTATATDAIGHA